MRTHRTTGLDQLGPVHADFDPELYTFSHIPYVRTIARRQTMALAGVKHRIPSLATFSIKAADDHD